MNRGQEALSITLTSGRWRVHQFAEITGEPVGLIESKNHLLDLPGPAIVENGGNEIPDY